MWVVQDQRNPHMLPWQGRGSSKLKLSPPPRRVSLPPKLLRNRCWQTEGRLLSLFRAAHEEISTFITCMLNCELAENELLSPPPAQDMERTEGRRTSGRSSGAGRPKDKPLTPSASLQVRPPPISAIFTFLSKNVLYPPANLGASRTIFQSL
jgi:hypothetical protein